MVQDRIEREIEIEAPVARVWALLTESQHLGRWFGDAGATVDLRPGGALTLSWIEHGTGRAVVETVEPMRTFAFRWAGPPDTDPAPGNSTLVAFTLTESGAGTLLRVVESGFARLDGDDASRDEAREGNVGGWAAELDELRRYASDVSVHA